ncbi:hypothetical protein AWB80_03582 [Caballeronia pedi]|uniref:Uncharacterized protein n=1 Tax=Caballeronia pedi TaxID=1777141 RepID=A0A158BHP6_9BURK|nr:hypothetical protein [Caballeronia pedi]SAK69582.1 hypothetical protein AWB80_03582 [Caballeronia pedi]
MIHLNFEALGRYHATLDAFQELRSKRSTALAELARTVRQNTGRHGKIVSFDAAAVQEKLQNASTVDAELMQCVDALNEYAAEVGKPQVQVESPSTY